MPPRDYWDFFVGECRKLDAPLYERISQGIGGDPELRALAESGRPGQPPANMLLGAVHFRLLRGARHRLRDFYPNLNGGRTSGEDPFPVFRDFVATRRDEIAGLVTSRITNTNEVGRSGILHAGFRVLAAEADAPLHLVEIGPSAGLNLIWDKYGVRYNRDGESFATETPGSELTIDVTLRGERIPPLGPPPQVASRVGLERNPVDLDDADSRDWLRALVWPDHVGRFARLDKALEIRAREKPEIRIGDALELLTDALARVPRNETLCVYHSLVTYQFTHEMRETLDHILIAAGLRRPVWRLALEWVSDNNHPLRLTRYEDGIKDERTLALCDPHGAWIEWRA